MSYFHAYIKYFLFHLWQKIFHVYKRKREIHVSLKIRLMVDIIVDAVKMEHPLYNCLFYFLESRWRGESQYLWPRDVRNLQTYNSNCFCKSVLKVSGYRIWSNVYKAKSYVPRENLLISNDKYFCVHSEYKYFDFFFSISFLGNIWSLTSIRLCFVSRYKKNLSYGCMLEEKKL